MKITGILKDKHVKGRFNVRFDGLEGTLPISDETIVENGLKVGLEIDRERLDEILKEDEKRRAISASFNLLSFSQRSRKELAGRLKLKSFSPQAVSHALDRLAELGYLNDNVFSRNLLNLRRSQGKGSELIKFEMKRKGISNEVINEVFRDNPLSAETEAEEVLPLARKKLSLMRGLTKEVAARRLMGFLARRGFSVDTARAVLRLLKSDPGSEE